MLLFQDRCHECAECLSQQRPGWGASARFSAIAVLVIALALLGSHAHGLDLAARGTAAQGMHAALQGTPFARLLAALAAIIALGWVLARLLGRLGQPPVMGEVLAGILLGPSVLGPELSALVMPPAIASHMEAVGKLGVMLYMFLVGLELNPALLRQHASSTVAAALGGLVFPFVIGLLVALPLHAWLAAPAVPLESFVLFMGVAMSVTAFPVLARILSDFRLQHSQLGTMALGCAVVSDIAAWCLLALAVGVARARMGEGLITIMGLFVLVACLLLLGRPAMLWVFRHWEAEDRPWSPPALIFLALVAVGLTCEIMGVHAFFGAFFLGAVIPRDSSRACSLTGQFEGLTRIVLLPVFLAYTGMRTRLDLFTEPLYWLICATIVLAATAGKLGGTLAAARFSGLDWRQSAVLGALMNTRGLMELVVLNVGLDLGVITPLVFSMMVVMALVTTALTPVLLRLLKAEAVYGRETAPQAAGGGDSPDG